MNSAQNDTVAVAVLGVFLEPSTQSSIVLLGERQRSDRVLPIFVGPAEAQAILLALQGVKLPRPATHDLLADVLAVTDTHVVAVVVTDLEAGTFIADLVLEADGDVKVVSARPSDGIALALRTGADISVARVVMDEAAVDVEREADQPFDEDEIEAIVSSFNEFLATAEPSDFDLESSADADVELGSEHEVGGDGENPTPDDGEQSPS